MAQNVKNSKCSGVKSISNTLLKIAQPVSDIAPQGRKPVSPEDTAAEGIYETLLGLVPTHRNLL